MLGERGLWFKMTFFEGSSRVPLMICDKDLSPHLETAPVSTLDVLPTVCDLAGIDMSEIMPWTDGTSLVRIGQRRGDRAEPVLMEYAAEASYAPLVGIREGDWKYIHCDLDPPQLFNLADDPNEQTNLADDPTHARGRCVVRKKGRRKVGHARL
jgi:choline-sulfatase